MKLIEIYNKVVQFGKECDIRDKSLIKSYPDSAILYGDPETEVKKILVGIDIEVGEMVLADRLRQKQGLDLVLGHHPDGEAWAIFYEVMMLQVDLLVRAGVERKVASGLINERKNEVERRVLPNNHSRAVDAARLLDIPFMCAHTPADNQVEVFIEKLMLKNKPKKIKDIIDILMKEPEYRHAAKNNAGPKILLGNPQRMVGKIFVEMTGGTEGNKEVYDKLYKTGVRTLISMHLSDEHLKKVREANMNVIIAGHISSDNLGLNLLLDKLEKKEKFSIIPCSGFQRFSRN